MIQDIFPHVLRNEFVPEHPAAPDGLLFRFEGDSLLCAVEGDAVRLPRVRDLPSKAERRYLFALDGVPCYLGMEGAQGEIGCMEWVQVRALRNRVRGPRELIFAAWTAFQLYNWYRDNCFCGRCGAQTTRAPDERAVVCPACRRRSAIRGSLLSSRLRVARAVVVSCCMRVSMRLWRASRRASWRVFTMEKSPLI